MNFSQLCPRGQKRELFIPVPGAEGIRAVAMEGEKPGRRLAVTTGMHGCEFVGIQAVREILEELNPKNLAGGIVFLPLINPQGFYQGAKQVVPQDGKNLNRCFPGNPSGSITERMAYALEQELYGAVDFLLDLHGGDINEAMEPLAFFPVGAGEAVERQARRAVQHLSIGYAVQSTAENGLYSYAAKCQVPALLVERGGRGSWSRQEVDACKKNIREMLDFLEILPGECAEKPPVEIVRAWYEQAMAPGFWYCKKCPGERVRKGEVLGELRNEKGGLVQAVCAQADGVALYLTQTLGVQKGDALIAYGQQKDAAAVQGPHL